MYYNGRYMKRYKNGSTMKQKAYARKILGAVHKTKKETALAVGYSMAVANSIKTKLEGTEGYANAVRDLAMETGDVVMHAYASIKNRDLDKEDLKTVLRAVEVLSNAFEKFSNDRVKDDNSLKNNRLRTVLMQRVENQTINAGTIKETKKKS